MEARIDSIRVEIETEIGGELLPDIELRLSGLDDKDGKMNGPADQEKFTFDLDHTVTRTKGEFFNLDVWESDQGQGKDCGGGLKVFFDTVEFGNKITLTEHCSDGTPKDGGYTTTVTIDGCVSFPNSCEVGANDCKASGPSGSPSKQVGSIVAIVFIIALSF